MKSAIPSFVGLNQIDDLDKAPFKFGHSLMDHPAMSMENLARVIPALPAEQVFYSSGKLSKGDNFDRAHIDQRNGLSLEETIARMMEVDSYIMVRSPELDPSFKELFAELKFGVDEVIRLRGAGSRAIDPMLYMFIASPGSVTPFHIDRYSTFLLQFRGQKRFRSTPPGTRALSSLKCSKGSWPAAECVLSMMMPLQRKLRLSILDPVKRFIFPLLPDTMCKMGEMTCQFLYRLFLIRKKPKGRLKLFPLIIFYVIA